MTSYHAAPARAVLRTSAVTLTLLLSSAAVMAGQPPPIRTSADNRVPACVTPERLMTFLQTRNRQFDPRYRDIAKWYRYFGEAWNVRWDYAFYQMAIETNFLSYRQPNGRMGDVSPDQHNFAGIGTTGGGVPGDAFPNVRTGVLAQIQHLVAYSGERLAKPVAPRTRLKQDDIVSQSLSLGRTVTFADLARRWAVDRKYGQSIQWVASQYEGTYCNGQDTNDLNTRRRPSADRRRSSVETLDKRLALGGPSPDHVIALSSDTTAGPMKPILIADASPTPLPKKAAVKKTAARAKLAPKTGPDISIPAWKATILPHDEITPAEFAAGPSAGAGDVNSPVAEGSTDAAPVAAGPVTAALLLPAREDLSTAPMMRLGSPPGLAAAWAARLLTPNATTSAPATMAEAATGPTASECRVLFASYGGTTTLLVKSLEGDQTRYTALTVLDGFEQSMFDGYVKSHAAGGEQIGIYPSRNEALAAARELCPNG